MGVKDYKYLIFDADHTLIDYDKDEYKVFTRMYNDFNIPVNKKMIMRCRELSVKTWNDVGLMDVHDKIIQNVYHKLYRSHLKLLFSRIYEEYPMPVTIESAVKIFLKYLENEAEEMEDAEKVLYALSENSGGKYKICVATNGIHDMQIKRLSRLDKYFYRVYISEDIGAIKPLPQFFEYILRDLSVKSCDCIMIGDSLDSDMAGAENVGMDGIWVNVFDRENRTKIIPLYETKRLIDIINILK